MPDGVLVGGWEYVIAAYGLTAVGLAAYVYSLSRRRRKTDKRD